MPHLFVDNLTVIDCSVLDPDRGLIGASWIVDIELFGELDKQSMVFDFAHVKKQIKKIIDAEVDHALVVPTQYGGIQINNNTNQNDQNDQSEIVFKDNNDQIIEHMSPNEALCLIEAKSITHDSVIDFLKSKIKPHLPANVEGLELTFREEGDDAFYYCYSHGLKKHDGNCQRIAHGHRSRIEISENGKRNPKLEQSWADELSDIYIGSSQDIANQTESRTRFSYDAPQGHFEIELDTSRIHFIESDSTVECIAEHIAKKIKQFHSKSDIRVKAFEGVKKGAIASF